MNTRRKPLLSPLVALLALAGGFLGAPASRADAVPGAALGAASDPKSDDEQFPVDKSMPKADQDEMRNEEKEGKAAADQIAKQEKLVSEGALSTRVQEIGAKIAAVAATQSVKAGFGKSVVYPFHYTYHIIKSKEINAFSLPGGYVYVYSGLLSHLTTDDEIAGVLGHETAHAAHHHISALMHEAAKMDTSVMLAALAAALAHVPMNDLGNLAAGAQYAAAARLNNHFSENAEEDADHTGMIYMQKAGYNPVGMLALLQRLKEVEDTSPDVELGFLQDHPLTSQRLAAARTELASLGVPVDPHNLRIASGTMIASVVDQGAPGHPTESDVRVGDKLLFRVSAENHDAAQAAANRLNQLLDGNLQLYEVKANGSQLIARDQPLIEFTAADAKLQASSLSSPDQIAASAAKTLRTLLWSQTVTATPEQTIEVGATQAVMP